MDNITKEKKMFFLSYEKDYNKPAPPVLGRKYIYFLSPVYYTEYIHRKLHGMKSDETVWKMNIFHVECIFRVKFYGFFSAMTMTWICVDMVYVCKLWSYFKSLEWNWFLYL